MHISPLLYYYTPFFPQREAIFCFHSKKSNFDAVSTDDERHTDSSVQIPGFDQGKTSLALAFAGFACYAKDKKKTERTAAASTSGMPLDGK